MKRKNIFKIGLVIVVAFAVCSISYTPSADILDDLTPFRPKFMAILFCPLMHYDVFKNGIPLIENALLSNGYKPWNIIKLTSSAATEENLIAAFNSIALRSKESDTLLVYIGAHGAYGPPHWGFGTEDGTVYFYELDSYISRVNCAGVGIVIECCEGGTAQWDNQSLKKDERVLITPQPTTGGVAYYAPHFATALNELADYSAVGNGDGAVTMKEAYDFIKYNNIAGSSLSKFWSGYPVIGLDPENPEHQLHITVQRWGDGRVDQIGEKTIKQSPSSERIYKWESQDDRAGQEIYPDMPKLTKVQLRMTQHDDPTANLRVSIKRYDPGYPYEIAYIEVPSSAISEFDNYNTFDFTPDVDLDIPNPYWIICETLNSEYEEKYYVAKTSSTDNYEGTQRCLWDHDETYPQGPYNQRWKEIENKDIHFVTYGLYPIMPPHIPKRPSGPVNGLTNQSYPYSFSATHVYNHQICIEIDWDDGSVPPVLWYGPYNSGSIHFISHSWSEPGSYNIRFRAGDAENLNEITDWSDVLHVEIEEP